MGDLVTPGQRLAVEIFQGGERTSGEEAGTYILDSALHAPFFIPAGGAAREGGEVVVGGEFQEAGMKMNGIAAAFQDHTAEIVGLQAPGRSAPVVKGMHVAEEEILQALVEKELQPQGAAIGEGEDEAGQTATGAADYDFAEMGPVGLSLLAEERAQAEKGFPARGSEFSHHAAELGDTARVATRANHLEEASGAQARILLQSLAQEVDVRIGQLSAEAGLAAEAIRVERPAHGVGMEKEFGRNGADLPMLGVKQMADASDLFIGDHAGPRKKDSPNAPGDRRSDRRPSRWGLQLGGKGENPARERPRSTQELEARPDSHGAKLGGKIDPSRGLASGGGKRAGGHDDRDALRGSAGDAGWLGGAAGGGIFHGNGNCNNAGPDHSGGRDKTPRRRKQSDTRTDERLWNTPPAPRLRRRAGQPAPIMEG
jgi:hypothetical protein